MNKPIVIVGSGFAAYQLVRMVRKQDQHMPVTVITRNSGDEYSKPDLSHVFSRRQQASDLVRTPAQQLAKELNIRLLTHTAVESIDINEKHLMAGGQRIDYNKLVLATGANSFIPPVTGDAIDSVITLNSLEEYKSAQEILANARSVMVIGAGLIGTEIAMDLANSGRQVVLTDKAEQVLPEMLPDFISARLEQVIRQQGITAAFGTQVETLQQQSDGIEVTLKNRQHHQVDVVISAAGLRPNLTLAKQAGLAVNRGIVVNRQLQTSEQDIYALGDCAEIEGKVLPFLQPIMLSASTLAKTLTNQPAQLNLPAMMVKVKTPLLPIQLGGKTSDPDLSWNVDASTAGMVARAFDQNQQMVGFITTDTMTSKAFALLKELPATL